MTVSWLVLCMFFTPHNTFFASYFKVLMLQLVEGALHNLYAEKEPIRSEAIKDTVDWVVARI